MIIILLSFALKVMKNFFFKKYNFIREKFLSRVIRIRKALISQADVLEAFPLLSLAQFCTILLNCSGKAINKEGRLLIKKTHFLVQ